MGKFQLNLKNRAEPLNSKIEILRGGIHQCKLSGCDFRGSCQVKACHANIKVNDANCLYLFFPDKDEFDKFDVMYALNINDKKLRDKYLAGKSKVYSVVLFNNILTRLRNNDKSLHCDCCGVTRTTKGSCLNKFECFKRIDFARKFINNSYLNNKEIKATLQDVWLVLNNKTKIEEFSNANATSTVTINDILGVSEEILEESNLLRTVV